MRYITRLRKENRAMGAELEAIRENLIHLESYLTSPKFHVDTTVQVSDVLGWVEAIRQSPGDAYAEAMNEG